MVKSNAHSAPETETGFETLFEQLAKPCAAPMDVGLTQFVAHIGAARRDGRASPVRRHQTTH